jgi:hypothetical protein
MLTKVLFFMGRVFGVWFLSNDLQGFEFQRVTPARRADRELKTDFVMYNCLSLLLNFLKQENNSHIYSAI